MIEIIVVLAWASVGFGQIAHQRVLLSAEDVHYPALARQARIQGDVEIAFHIGDDGVPIGTEPISGHPMLTQAALDNVATWRFKPVSAHDAHTYKTTFRFELDALNGPYDYGPKTIRHGLALVEVQVVSTWIGGGPPRALNCPKEKVRAPASTTADFLELDESDYQIRLGADGSVIWSNTDGEHAFTVDSRRARKLVASFNTEQIWNLCGLYEGFGKTVRLTLHTGVATKKVEDAGYISPHPLPELEDEVNLLARTHEWRHGDPSAEPIWNIRDERVKPDLPPLAAAARDCNSDRVKQLIAAGENLSAADASGWTPLMYATQCGNDTEKRLLKAGADPNQSSYRGDTALMVRALQGYLDEDLLRAGANINLQDNDGRTILMFLASQGSGEIEYAIEAGANSTMKDTRGLTAFDYLKIANCRANPMVQGLEAIPAPAPPTQEVDEKDSSEETSCNPFPDEWMTKALQQLSAPYDPLRRPHIPKILRMSE
ncbi:outer membrane transport energization protein TonB [Candidatus Koribacter versatilis Ellin345]|uniref:Outer membrane transport energization protein TonB n=1 Tax=Koribacter versatilis (strain Ellin345) TaxID=204669 RepID=Q1IPU8_KORVE|nr:TonB family protein [Candidatus Koribacter versatilis]ABF41102.1 outer membrane transport energization protein TonB [Candidatus Koribacter versatilis Ellin345]